MFEPGSQLPAAHTVQLLVDAQLTPAGSLHTSGAHALGAPPQDKMHRRMSAGSGCCLH